jgi:signal peptidase I
MLQRARQNTVVETIFLLVVAVALAVLLQAFAIKPYKIPSGSMEPTLHVRDRVLVNRFSKRILGNEPKVGDITVFHPPVGADDQGGGSQCGDSSAGDGTGMPCDRATPKRSKQSFIKRVVAVGGDTIAIRNGRVIRNGRATKEPFAAACVSLNGDDICNFPKTITVPKGYVYMMGDNRGNSDDSRFWGPIPTSWVIGKAFATYWPPSRIGGAG